jgi:hypothetical protein
MKTVHAKWAYIEKNNVVPRRDICTVYIYLNSMYRRKADASLPHTRQKRLRRLRRKGRPHIFVTE